MRCEAYLTFPLIPLEPFENFNKTRQKGFKENLTIVYIYGKVLKEF